MTFAVSPAATIHADIAAVHVGDGVEAASRRYHPLYPSPRSASIDALKAATAPSISSAVVPRSGRRRATRRSRQRPH